MLDINALSKLQSLKQEIRSNTQRFTGKVRASSGRYGFVSSDEGKSYFLSPEEMEKVLPDDVVDFRVESQSDGKEQAFVEKVLSSSLHSFWGTYLVRGKGHFIESDPSISRWIFVPPQKRLNAQDGDLVKASICKHPFSDGKAQAAVEQIIGNLNSAGIEREFTLAKWQMPSAFNDAVKAEVQGLLQQGLDQALQNRTDLTHLPFVTIDSANTRDIDDALFAEAQSDGWTLWVAIADPSAVVLPGSALDTEARHRATSVYFPDGVIPMLPTELSEQLCSLHQDELRPAVVVELRVAQDGSIRQVHLHQASMKNHAKLSYSQVSQFINGDGADIRAEVQGPLLHLHDCANALSAWRGQHALLVEDRPDFKLLLDDQGKVQDIIRLERTVAHRIVEECMLACNRSVANWLAEQHTGFFVEHTGLRTERMGEMSALLKEQLGVEEKPSFHELGAYVKWLQQAEKADSKWPLRLILNRQQDRSNFSLEAKPHMGLGFAHYTTFTSPLRKYNDLLIHRIIKNRLNQDDCVLPSNEDLLALQTAQTNGRLAAMQAEIWLKLQWLEKQDKEQIYEGTLVYLTPNSFTVRLDNTGIEGQIDRRKSDEWVFDSKTMSQCRGEECFMLGSVVRVKLKEVQPQQRTVRFVLA